MNLCPKEGDNGKYGYIDPYYHLNWRLRGKKIDFDTPEFEIIPIYEEARKFINGFAEVKMNGKWGVIKKDGKFIIEPQYEDIVKRKKGLYRVKVDGKWGLMNDHEEIIHEPQYDEVGKCHDNLIDVKIGNKIGFINLQWQLIVEPQFDSFHFYYDIEDDYPFGKRIHSYGLMRVEIGEKKGLIDTKDGHYIFEPQFDFIGDKVFCWFLRIKKNGKWGIISTHGEVIAEPVYDEIDGFGERISSYEVAKVRIDDKWGVINREGEYIIEPQSLTIDVRDGHRYPIEYVNLVIGDKNITYLKKSKFIVDKVYFKDFSTLHRYSSARFVVDGKMGFIDSNGKIFIEPQFDDSEAFYDGYAIVKVHGKWGVIDLNGDYFFEPRFDSIDKPKHESCGRPLIRVKIGDKIGFLNIDNHLVIEPQYEETEGNYDNIKVKTDGKWGIINNQGAYVVEPRFDEIKKDSVFINDNRHLFIWVRMGKKWGLIKDYNIFVVSCVFDEVNSFSNPYQLAIVRIGDKWGCINQYGRFVADPKFDEIKRFDYIGLAAVRVGLKWGYINDTGCYSIEPEFDEVDVFDYTTELAAVRVGDRWGFINRSGQFVIEPKFEYAEKFEYGLALIKIDGKRGCVDKFGRIYDVDYYLRNKAGKRSYYDSYYGSAQESADDGWDMIAGDAGFDSGNVDSEGVWEFLGLD